MGLELSDKYKRVLDDGSFQQLRITAPWPHYILDELIAPDQFTRIQNILWGLPKRFKTIDDHPAKIELCYMQQLELAEFFFSPAVRALLQGIAQCPLVPNADIAIQFRQMTEDSPAFPPHVDLIDEPSLVSLYYVAPNWADDRGGEIVLTPTEQTAENGADAKWIAPIENRLLLFLSGDTHWHSVRRVKNWKRLMVLTEWLTKTSGAPNA